MAALQVKDLQALFEDNAGNKMPCLFVGHGNPLNAIDDNPFSLEWESIGQQLPVPKAILCISAHWLTRGTFVALTPQPETIHDFYGFPPELHQYQYPAPGAPDLAKEVRTAIASTTVHEDFEWGLDHGCWSVLTRMFPAANIPVFQMSLDATAPAEKHYELGKELAFLREKGVLIVGSGNIVHNLAMVHQSDKAYDWALEFDALSKELIEKGDHTSLSQYQNLGSSARLSIPTSEHYLPLLYTLALQGKNDTLSFFNEKTTAGSISMRSILFS